LITNQIRFLSRLLQDDHHQLLVLPAAAIKQAIANFIHLSGIPSQYSFDHPYGCMGKDLTRCFDRCQMFGNIGFSFSLVNA